MSSDDARGLMGRSRLLFVSSRFLFPADSGGKIRTRDILRGMKGGRFHITLVSPEPAGGSARFAEELRRVCDRFVGWPETNRGPLRTLNRCISLLSRVPVAVASDRSKSGRRVVMAELARDPGVLVADFPHSAVLLPTRLFCPSILFTHNVEAEIFRRHAEVAPSLLHRAIWRSQERKMQRFEHDVAQKSDAVIAVSERDGRHFAGIRGRDRVFVIPTGVDVDYFSYRYTQTPPVPRDGGTVVFTASMNWPANVDCVRYFMDKVWPHVVRARPAAKMVVVGHSPPRTLVDKAGDRGLAWSFTGFVDDIRPYVRDANVYVVPLRVGGGTRIKVYEAMAMGCPVVSTSLGIEGLPVRPGHDCLIADTEQAFAAAVLRLLERAAERRTLAENARRLVEGRFSAKVVASVFEDVCMRAMKLGTRVAV